MSQTISHHRTRQLEAVDMLPGPLRECVHEFGHPIVNACVQAGVKDPAAIRQLVHEIWLGARQMGQRRHGVSRKGAVNGSAVIGHLDWLLIQSGSEITARTLVRVLWQNSLVILPRDPTGVMIEASMAEVSGHNDIVTKHQKHRRRLRAAIDAAARRLWPHLFTEAKP